MKQMMEQRQPLWHEGIDQERYFCFKCSKVFISSPKQQGFRINKLCQECAG